MHRNGYHNILLLRPKKSNVKSIQSKPEDAYFVNETMDKKYEKSLIQVSTIPSKVPTKPLELESNTENLTIEDPSTLNYISQFKAEIKAQVPIEKKANIADGH